MGLWVKMDLIALFVFIQFNFKVKRFYLWQAPSVLHLLVYSLLTSPCGRNSPRVSGCAHQVPGEQ